MFDKFGEFDSCEEMNRAAAAQLAEGDDEALVALARENGIDTEDVAEYMDGIADRLATPLMAAYGKLDIETAELEPQEIMEDWLDYIRVQCAEDPDMAAAVRRKGKSLKGCIAALLAWSFRNAKDIDPDIKRAINVTYPVRLGIPGMRRAKAIIREYYLGKEAVS